MEDRVSDLMNNEWITTVFAEQPLALPRSAKDLCRLIYVMTRLFVERPLATPGLLNWQKPAVVLTHAIVSIIMLNPTLPCGSFLGLHGTCVENYLLNIELTWLSFYHYGFMSFVPGRLFGDILFDSALQFPLQLLSSEKILNFSFSFWINLFIDLCSCKYLIWWPGALIKL